MTQSPGRHPHVTNILTRLALNGEYRSVTSSADPRDYLCASLLENRPREIRKSVLYDRAASMTTAGDPRGALARYEATRSTLSPALPLQCAYQHGHRSMEAGQALEAVALGSLDRHPDSDNARGPGTFWTNVACDQLTQSRSLIPEMRQDFNVLPGAPTGAQRALLSHFRLLAFRL